MKIPTEIKDFLSQINNHNVFVFYKIGGKKRAIIGRATVYKNFVDISCPVYSIDCVPQGTRKESFALFDFIMKNVEIIDLGG